MRAAAQANNRLRQEGGGNVLAAAQAAGVRRYILQSIAFWAAPGKGLADEETSLAFDTPTAIADGICTIALIERRLLAVPNSDRASTSPPNVPVFQFPVSNRSKLQPNS